MCICYMCMLRDSLTLDPINQKSSMIASLLMSYQTSRKFFTPAFCEWRYAELRTECGINIYIGMLLHALLMVKCKR